MSMITWEDMHDPAPSGDDPVFEVAFRRLTNEDFPMPPSRSEELAAMTSAERQILLSWIAAGAPPK